MIEIANFVGEVHKKGHEEFVKAMMNGMEMPEMQKLMQIPAEHKVPAEYADTRRKTERGC